MQKKLTGSTDPILEANIQFHTALARQYDGSQPYFSDPINTERVSGILAELAAQAGNEALLDIGCGTGFICALAQRIFKQVVGLDATPAMLSLVKPSPNIHLILGDARHVPYPDGSFNACTANGVLHHMEDLQPVAREICRILKPGGMFYSDEDPNHDYFDFFDTLDTGNPELSELMRKEHDNLTNKAREMKEQFNVDEEITQLAEYQKMVKGGMSTLAMRQIFLAAGFSEVQIEYRWYLGQASVRKQMGREGEKTINDYLQAALPLSSRLFKYFKLVATKATS